MQSTSFQSIQQYAGYLPFAVRYSLEERREKFEAQIDEYPDYIHLIVEKENKAKLPQLEKIRYMCEPEHTFLMIQKTIESKVNKAAQGTAYKKGGRVSFCLYVGRTMPHSESKMHELYQKYKAPDGFLYLKYTEMQKF